MKVANFRNKNQKYWHGFMVGNLEKIDGRRGNFLDFLKEKMNVFLY